MDHTHIHAIIWWKRGLSPDSEVGNGSQQPPDPSEHRPDRQLGNMDALAMTSDEAVRNLASARLDLHKLIDLNTVWVFISDDSNFGIRVEILIFRILQRDYDEIPGSASTALGSVSSLSFDMLLSLILQRPSKIAPASIIRQGE